MNDIPESGGNGTPVFDMVQYRILGKPYSSWRAILAETGESDTVFLIALRELHGLEINKEEDPFLFVTQDTQQMADLAESGVPNPTMLQILLTAKVIDLSEERAKERWLKTMQDA